MPLNTSIRWAMSIVFALTWIQLVSAQGSHRVLAPPKNASSPADPHADLIREVERFVQNSDRSLDIDPDEIDPELLKMAQQWARQFQKPEDLPDEFRELLESLGPKIQSSENGFPLQPFPGEPQPQGPEQNDPNRSPNTTKPRGETEPGDIDKPGGNNSLIDPAGNLLDPDIFQPPNFNESNKLQPNDEPSNSERPSQRPGNSDSELSNDPNAPDIRIPIGERNGERTENNRSPDRSPIESERTLPNGQLPVEGNSEVRNQPDLGPGDIVPEVQQDTESHRSEILNGLRDSNLTIKQQWNRILEQARRDAILDDNPAQEGNGDSVLSRFLEETFGETIADVVDQTHQPQNQRQNARTIRGRDPTSNSDRNRNGPNRGRSTNQRPGPGEDPIRIQENRNGNTPNRNTQTPNRSDDSDHPSNRVGNNPNGNGTNGNGTNGNGTNGNGTNGNGTNGNGTNDNGTNDNGTNGNLPDRSRPNANNTNANNTNGNRPNANNSRTNNSRTNNSSRPETPNRNSDANSNSGFSKSIKDLANFGENLFMKVANANQSNSRDPNPETSSPENQVDGESSDAFSIQTPVMLLMVLLVLVGSAIWLAKVRRQKIAVAARIAAAAVRMPSDLATKTDVLDAFHAMSAKTAAAESPWWTHRRAARELFESVPQGRHALEALTTVYEQARYLPGDEPLDDNELKTARQALTLYDHQ